MSSPGIIPSQVLTLQREVANPAASAWVAANAGAGKTHVLAQRVINLLLNGVEPEKILCITFTKAAAANMAKRVFDTLAAWTTLDDAALDNAIRERSNMAPNPTRRALARRLFARALETPGGLKVQTIHAFCTRLLHQFPFEANVAARFNVLDATEQTQLLEELTLHVLLDGAETPGSALGGALATAMTAAADQTFRDIVRDTIGQRDAINRWVAGADGLAAAVARLSKSLGIDPSMTLAQVENEIVNGPILPSSQWAAVAALCKASSARDQEQCERLTVAERASGAERINAYLKVFLDSKCQPRGSLLTQNLARQQPALAQRLADEQSRVLLLRERRNAVICRDRSAALVTVAYEVLSRYEKAKERRGLLDYDDLIDKTLALLTTVEAAWVHYKLDLGIDHLLIDEAQDTSSKQWDIVRRLVAEFTAGAGARAVTRTIFAVGDDKQSIYSFQSAAPAEFEDMRQHFQTAHTNAALDFFPRKFEHSFRSGENILAAVDLVFKSKAMAASVTTDAGGFPAHIALPNAAPGLVEIWQPTTPDQRRDIDGWDAPFDTVNETRSRVKLARRIATAVRRLIESDAARCGDVLILVRQRGELFEAVIRALKNAGLAVAGADRLMLAEHIAVMDLMGLADALLLPEDDLALAAVLRSPLFDFTDDDLFAIAHARGRASLRDALARHAGERQLFADATVRLDRLAQAARRDTPFAFYADVLGAGDARRRFLARLGLEANDALDEFLNLAFDYERRETPSLQGFIAWLREARAEVKRDMEIARDEVRVMTVHGAKGLEAPIVILADTMTPPTGPKPPRLLKLLGGALVWAGRKDDDVTSVAAARQQAQSEAENEYRRLLYVAMTRAEQRLIVGGADGLRTRPPRCWYDLIREPLAPFLVEEDDGGEKVLRYRKTPAAAPAEQTIAASATLTPQRPELPSWLRQPAAVETPRPAPLSPSSAFDEEIGRINGPAAPSAFDRQRALEKGRLVHRLMQSLPDIPAERRRAAAERYLANAAATFSPPELEAIAANVLAILDDTRFALLFSPGSKAEVPIVGRIPRQGADPILVAGQVDRLAVTDDAVLIADYKSDRVVPRDLTEVAAYVRQLALYRAVLARIYPHTAVRAALVFTEGPRLVEVPAAAMASALASVLANTRHAAVKVT
jgi:ATP-dependent helicase/nuclease subunit A